MSDDIVGQCTCTSEKMTLHCPAVCLRPPRGVTREEVANIGSCLHLSANRRQIYFCFTIYGTSMVVCKITVMLAVSCIPCRLYRCAVIPKTQGTSRNFPN